MDKWKVARHTICDQRKRQLSFPSMRDLRGLNEKVADRFCSGKPLLRVLRASSSQLCASQQSYYFHSSSPNFDWRRIYLRITPLVLKARMGCLSTTLFALLFCTLLSQIDAQFTPQTYPDPRIDPTGDQVYSNNQNNQYSSLSPPIPWTSLRPLWDFECRTTLSAQW